MTIAIDFDGTCVSHEFPKIGKDIGAVSVLKELVENEYIEPSTKSICKVGEKNPKYVHLTFEQRKEIAEAYSIKKMKKKSILVHFNIGGRILNRILKEFSVQKNIPKYKQNEKI